ncbi:single-stranded DNA-binding protein [Methylobacterium sp. WSM2598]|uniref:single-stranded DNA-binding protein n=1 Tax=Methylobacterium sp. WSM2598 TaxID=398261 RepID=UPI000369A9E8|nr:single-stranded DNA-binding protein [Methylobacterium sp. WSM2598]
MAGSVNKATLLGNLGKDPESRTFQNGGKSVSFTLATNETWKDKNTGERQEKTQWHNIVITNEQLGGIAERFLKKGSKVYIEGAIETRKYEKAGQDVYITEIVLKPYHGELTLLDDKGTD